MMIRLTQDAACVEISNDDWERGAEGERAGAIKVCIIGRMLREQRR